jgi:antitoxin component YwqK of YwqJK toxin-antitoxin module
MEKTIKVAAPAVILFVVFFWCGCSKEHKIENLCEREGKYFSSGDVEAFTGGAVEYYQNSKKKREIKFKDGKKHGKEIHWYEDGMKKLEVSFINGKFSDKWLKWFRNGKNKEEINFKNGEKNGKWIEWYPNGRKKYEGEFKDWEPHGQFIDWYENGQKSFQREAKRGIPNGKWVKWYKNGHKKAEGEWKNGQKHRTWIKYYDNGRKQEEIGFDKGRRDGKWIEFYKNGRRKFEGEWLQGKLIGEGQAWSKDGSEENLDKFLFKKALYPPCNNKRTGKRHRKHPFQIIEEIKSAADLNDFQTKTLCSLRKVNDHPLYVMEYYGSYHFDIFLKSGLGSNPASFLEIVDEIDRQACTTLTGVTGNRQRFLARNQDSFGPDYPVLLLFCDPPEAYASVSLLNLRYTGCRKKTPDTLPPVKRKDLLAAPYWPHDGMNECGLAIGHMTVTGDRVHDPFKITIHGMRAIRLVLDYSKNVDEAIHLLENINTFRSESGHFLISDANDHSAVVEYVDGKMAVTRNSRSWQIATNTIVYNTPTNRLRSLCWRFGRADAELRKSNRRMSQTDVMRILKRVSMDGAYQTKWSVVYNLARGEMDLVVGRQYKDIIKFKLKN